MMVFKLPVAAFIDNLNPTAYIFTMLDVWDNLPYVCVLLGRTVIVKWRVEAGLDGHGLHARWVRHLPRFDRPGGCGRHDPWPYPTEPLRDVAKGGESGSDEHITGAEQVHLAQRPPIMRGVSHLLPPLVAGLVHPDAVVLDLDPLIVPRAQRGDQHRRVVHL